MPHALFHAVGGNRKGKATREGGAAGKAELTQPGAREQAGERVDHELQDVPRGDGANGGVERPEEKSERPAGIVRLRRRLRAKRVRIEPGSVCVLQLMSDEPPVVERLQMIARRCLAVTRRASREKRRARVQNGGPRRADAGDEVQQRRECRER